MPALQDFFYRRFDLERKSIATSVGYGLYLISAQSFDSSPGFRDLVRLVSWIPLNPELVWGSIMILAGLLQLLGIGRDLKVCRRIGTLVMGAVWLLMGLCFLSANLRSPAIITYGLFAWSNYCLFHQISRGYRR